MATASKKATTKAVALSKINDRTLLFLNIKFLYLRKGEYGCVGSHVIKRKRAAGCGGSTKPEVNSEYSGNSCP